MRVADRLYPKWRRYGGAISGGVLGGIVANVPGAMVGGYYGYKAGKATEKTSLNNSNMARGRRDSGYGTGGGRKRKLSSITAGRGKFARKKSVVYVGRKTRAAYLSRIGAGSGTTGDIRSVVRRVKKPAPKLKQIRKLKVSKMFKKKVKQVLGGTKPKGMFQEIHLGEIDVTPTANYKNYGIAPATQVYAANPLTFGYDYQWCYGRTRSVDWSFDMFQFTEFMDACEVLFFNKLNQITNTERRHVQINDTDRYGLNNSPFRVVNSSVGYTMKNNGRRKYDLLVYKCSPRTLTSASLSSNEASVPSAALYSWFDAHEQDNQATGADVDLRGVNIDGFVTGATPNCTNVDGINPNHLNATPYMTNRFTKLWKMGVEKVTLEPGQEYNFVVQGPKNVMFDARQWRLRSEGPQNLDPGVQVGHAQMKPGWSQSMFIVLKPDVLPTGDGGVGRFGITAAESESNHITAHQIAVQCTKTFVIEMPETTGTAFVPTTVTIGSNPINYVPMLNRKYAYYLNTWRSGAVTTRALELDVQNPGDDEAMVTDEGNA